MAKDERGKTRARTNFLRWLDLEHELADRQLDAFQVLLLTGRSDPPALAALERLVADVAQHLRDEEEGLFPWVVATLPGAKAKVDALIAEHGGILVAMREARDAASARREAAVQRVRRLLETHAAAERELAAAALEREEDALDW